MKNIKPSFLFFFHHPLLSLTFSFWSQLLCQNKASGPNIILYYCHQTRKSRNKINVGNHRYPYHNHIQKYRQTKQQGMAILFILNKLRICLLDFRLNLKIQQTMHIYVLQSELSWKLHMNNKTPLSLSHMLYQCLCGDMFNLQWQQQQQQQQQQQA